MSTVVVSSEDVPLGPALRRAWVAYQQRLDAALADAGFDDRRLPDGRVLRMCRDSPDTTIARIGRELDITRQGAAKIVADLRDRGYVTVEPSPTSGREKALALTPRAHEYLAAIARAARAIEDEVEAQLGPEPLEALRRLLGALGAEENLRMRDYIIRKSL